MRGVVSGAFVRVLALRRCLRAVALWLAFGGETVVECADCMEEVNPDPKFKVPPQVFAALLILVAVFMGGATERVPQGIVLAGMGVMILAAPPASWPDRKWLYAVCGLLAIAAAALLPAVFFYNASWRDIVQVAGISLPSALSPQPRLTLEAWLLLAAGITWMGWLMTIPWNSGSRTLAARFFVVGVMLLAVFMLVQWNSDWTPPGWLSAELQLPKPLARELLRDQADHRLCGFRAGRLAGHHLDSEVFLIP